MSLPQFISNNKKDNLGTSNQGNRDDSSAISYRNLELRLNLTENKSKLCYYIYRHKAFHDFTKNSLLLF